MGTQQLNLSGLCAPFPISLVSEGFRVHGGFSFFCCHHSDDQKDALQPSSILKSQYYLILLHLLPKKLHTPKKSCPNCPKYLEYSYLISHLLPSRIMHVAIAKLPWLIMIHEYGSKEYQSKNKRSWIYMCEWKFHIDKKLRN